MSHLPLMDPHQTQIESILGAFADRSLIVSIFPLASLHILQSQGFLP